MISFSFHDPATTAIDALSLHDALPIWRSQATVPGVAAGATVQSVIGARPSSTTPDRKSTRLNSSHLGISYAVFCLKKKNKPHTSNHRQRTDQQHENDPHTNISRGFLHT